MVTNPKPSENVFLPWRNQLDEGGKYRLVNPHSLYRGKSYSEWTTDWFNCFLSADADKRTSGPVVFLRSHGLPNSKTAASDAPPPNQVTDSDYPTTYVNDPNIRVGSDRLQIFHDQAVFVPIIVGYEMGGTVSQYRDWGNMQDFTGLLIDNGDNPPAPYQITVDNVPIHLEDGEEKTVLRMEDFRITTPIFTAVVPEAPYGTSIKDFLEEGPIPAGTYPAMVDGYFVILRFNPGSYWVHSWASAGREARGPYFSELLYQIDVGTRSVPHGSITAMRPARNQALFARIQKTKTEHGELTPGESQKMREYVGSMQELRLRVSAKDLLFEGRNLAEESNKSNPEQADKINKSTEELKEAMKAKQQESLKTEPEQADKINKSTEDIKTKMQKLKNILVGSGNTV